jgi:tetratricopeptide (TPR) repeat protein
MANQESNETQASEFNNRGYELAESGHWQEAIECYQEALRLNPRNVHSLTNMGNALQALGRLPEALAYQDKALAIDPNNALAWANKAVVLSGLNRRSDAISCYDRSLENDPSNKITWFNKGVALFLIGKRTEAIQCMDYILENLDSRMKNALGAKAEILQAQGRGQDAAKCFERIKGIEADGGAFSFASTYASITISGSKVDARKVLRGFEAVIRKRTGLAQIAADFIPLARMFESTRVEYSSYRGYRVYLHFGTFTGASASATENEIVATIQNHAQKMGIRPVPPPIPDTATSVEQDLNFDAHANYYDALAHDGGYVLAFYREKQGNKGVLLRHVPSFGFVHYHFLYKPDYMQLLRDAAEHCSAFLDLSYLGDDDMNEDTLRTFLRENDIYSITAQHLH